LTDNINLQGRKYLYKKSRQWLRQHRA